MGPPTVAQDFSVFAVHEQNITYFAKPSCNTIRKENFLQHESIKDHSKI